MRGNNGLYSNEDAPFLAQKNIPCVDIKSKHPKLSKYKNSMSFDLREQLQKKITFNDFAN
jgi:hypothetical protein